jgi:hypothetical protein
VTEPSPIEFKSTRFTGPLAQGTRPGKCVGAHAFVAKRYAFVDTFGFGTIVRSATCRRLMTYFSRSTKQTFRQEKSSAARKPCYRSTKTTSKKKAKAGLVQRFRHAGELVVVRKVTAEEQRVKKNANLNKLKTRSGTSARSSSTEQLKRALWEAILFGACWHARHCRPAARPLARWRACVRLVLFLVGFFKIYFC